MCRGVGPAVFAVGVCRGVGPVVFAVGVCRGVGPAVFAVGVCRGEVLLCLQLVCVQVWDLLCLQ